MFEDFKKLLGDQRDWSWNTFGAPVLGADDNHVGVLAHARKEIAEIENVKGQDLEEWIDGLILFTDGAMRCGFTPQNIIEMWEFKNAKNVERKWPPIGSVPRGQPVEHIREGVPSG